MNEEQQKSIDELRSQGYAIAIFTPEELQGARSDRVEDIMSDRGQIAIEDLKYIGD